MSTVASIGRPPWSRDELVAELETFAALYATRPIRDNEGGMRSAHMFAVWTLARKLQPEAIIESGVWRGQSSWLLEQACPDAKLHCIDIDLSRVAYLSERARYFEDDFSTLYWDDLPRDKTLLFFDDHQDAVRRVRSAKALGFQHLLFEDNYPASRGDCYSLKKAFAGVGFCPERRPTSIATRVKRALGLENDGSVPASDTDAVFLRDALRCYAEFPPVFQPDLTRWGDDWNQHDYPTPAPLLSEVAYDYQQIYRDEAVDYTWICYAQLEDDARPHEVADTPASEPRT